MELFTAQMARGRNNFDLLDITVKGQDPIGKVFAPTWDMVMDHKKKKHGHMADNVYITDYHAMMLKSYYANQLEWAWVLRQHRVVIACYCPAGAFCHRILLAQYLVKLGAVYLGEI